MKYSHLFFILFCTLFVSCKSNYLLKNQPQWLENQIAKKDNLSLGDTLHIVSYNIEHSKQIDQAIEELNTHELKDASILFLQEMDENGVIKIAKALNLNYLYYPISKYKKDDRNFGNAILSHFELKKPKKIILPHQSLNGGKRAATIAQINIDNQNILLVSLHLETIVLSRKKRIHQLEYLLESIANEKNIDHTIIAGDFNSFFPRDLKLMTALLNQHSFSNSNPNLSWTSKAVFGILKSKLDHIMIKNLKSVKSGVCHSCAASDHKAVWSSLQLKY